MLHVPFLGNSLEQLHRSRGQCHRVRLLGVEKTFMCIRRADDHFLSILLADHLAVPVAIRRHQHGRVGDVHLPDVGRLLCRRHRIRRASQKLTHQLPQRRLDSFSVRFLFPYGNLLRVAMDDVVLQRSPEMAKQRVGWIHLGAHLGDSIQMVQLFNEHPVIRHWLNRAIDEKVLVSRFDQ